jgi:hypothetical protein
MKITKSKLAQLIKEELEAVLEAWKTAGQWTKTRGRGTGPAAGALGEPAAIGQEREKEETHDSPLCQSARDEFKGLASVASRSAREKNRATKKYKLSVKRAETFRKEQESEGCINKKDLAGIKGMRKNPKWKPPEPVGPPEKPPVTAAAAQKGIEKAMGRGAKKPGKFRRPVGAARRRRE